MLFVSAVILTGKKSCRLFAYNIMRYEGNKRIHNRPNYSTLGL